MGKRIYLAMNYYQKILYTTNLMKLCWFVYKIDAVTLLE